MGQWRSPLDPMVGIAVLSPIHRIFAVIARLEDRYDTLFPPYLVPCAFRIFNVILVTLKKMAVNARLAFLGGFIIAVVDNGSRHPTEDRFDDVQELCTCRKWDQNNLRSTICSPVLFRVKSFHFSLKLF